MIIVDWSRCKIIERTADWLNDNMEWDEKMEIQIGFPMQSLRII